jgi:hypothetical protein
MGSFLPREEAAAAFEKNEFRFITPTPTRTAGVIVPSAPAGNRRVPPGFFV